MNLVEGVDVSHWNKPQDWHKHKAEGKQFVFVKATDGVEFTDPMFKAHVQGARSAGLLVGAYHFFKPKFAAQDQARHFLAICASVDLDFPPTLDMEEMNGAKPKDPVDHRRWVDDHVTRSLLWLDFVEHEVKKTPFLYSGLPFINDLNNPAQYHKYPLWLAQYRNRMPTIPHPFEKWTFWQNSGTTLDHDYFNGSIEELRSLS